MSNWITNLIRKISPFKSDEWPSSDEIIAEFEARTGSTDRAKQWPAWALLFQSPFAPSDRATSWIGGAPKAPCDFDWPKDKNGKPLHFVAQIDLAALKPEPTTDRRPPGLPGDGAMLIFIGESYAIHILNAAQMANAIPQPLPRNLGPVRDLGFFGEGISFARRAVTPVAYLDAGDGRPDFMPERFHSPLDWIVNWGIAAIEAQNVIDALNLDMKFGKEFLEWYNQTAEKSGFNDVVRNKFRHYTVVRATAPAVIAAVEAWRDLALSKPQDQAVDTTALREIMRLRLALHDEMDAHNSKFIVAGKASGVWNKIEVEHPGLRQGEGYGDLPSWMRPFIDLRETDWRGHRLFGLEPPFDNNCEDLRGQDCVISIAADELLHTKSEHHYGFSIWCKRDRMAKGRFEKGQLVHHCAV